MILYNCKTDRSAASYGKQQFIITKFDADLNVEASYLLNAHDCTCPAWPRKSHCKHQDMLDKFRWREYVDTEWFLDADGGWHKPVKPAFPIEPGSTPFPSEPKVSPLSATEAAEGSPALPPSAAAPLVRRRLK